MFKSNYDPESRFLRCKWNLTEENVDLKNKDLFLFWFIAIYLRDAGKNQEKPHNHQQEE